MRSKDTLQLEDDFNDYDVFKKIEESPPGYNLEHQINKKMVDILLENEDKPDF